MKRSDRVKILVELMHGLGDTVCTLPMLQLLRATFPNGEITILTKSSGTADIIESSNFLKGVAFSLTIRRYIFDVFRKSE